MKGTRSVVFFFGGVAFSKLVGLAMKSLAVSMALGKQLPGPFSLPGLLVAFWVRKVHKSSPRP